MQAFPANPTIYHPNGAPVFWAGPWRGPTFGQDAGDVRDVARQNPAGVRTVAAWADGPLGKCLSFAGTGYARWAATAFPAGDLTVEAWVTPTLVNGAFHTIFAGNGPVFSTWLFVDSGNHFNFFANGISRPGTTTVVAGGTYHVAAAVSGTTLSFYVNGASDAAAISTAAPGGFTSMFLGSRDTSFTQPYTGTVSDFRLSTYAKTASQVARDYARPAWRFERPRHAAAKIPYNRLRRVVCSSVD